MRAARVRGCSCGCRSAATSGRWPRPCTATRRTRCSQHKLKRAGDFNARSAALQSIQEFLGLADAPLRIECVDISHVQGTDVVASLVVFEDGLPRKSDYRHYAIREAAGDGRSDDVASIAEVTRRRFAGTWHDAQAPDRSMRRQGKSRRFAYPPNLFVVDGGAPQVNAAAAVLDELGVTDVAVIGLAKRLEEVWVPVGARSGDHAAQQRRALPAAAGARRGAPVRDHLPPQQAVQADDGVGTGLRPGLGEHRRKALVTHFGSVARLKEASVEEITAVPGIGVATAKAVLEALGRAYRFGSARRGDRR